MNADPPTEAEVLQLFSRIIEAMSRKDVDRCCTLFGDDPDALLLGTGVDEARTGLAAIREQGARDLGQSDELPWILSPHSVSAAGPVAWTSGNVIVRATVGGQTQDIPRRLTTHSHRRPGAM